MSEFDKAQCYFLFTYTPYSYSYIVYGFFLKCNKLFGQTVEYLERSVVYGLW